MSATEERVRSGDDRAEIVADLTASDFDQAQAEFIVSEFEGHMLANTLNSSEEEADPAEEEAARDQRAADEAEDQKKEFTPRALAALIQAETPIAVGANGTLYYYNAGVYLPNAEPGIKRRLQTLLADKWRVKHERETLAYLASARGLIPHPPRERINCTNGVYNLATKELEPHSPEDLTPVQITAAFDPDATCPTIDRFLSEVLPDPEDQALFYEIVGYLLIPDNTLEKAFMFTGSGANGKTTALELAAALLGRRNVSRITLQRLDEDRFAADGLHGRLANIFGDLDRRALTGTGAFKAITGGEEFEAQRKFRDSYNFRPYARLLFSANELPPTPDGTKGFYRRWIVLPFTQTFGEGTADPHLLEKLTTPEELSGLLNRAVGSLGELQGRGYFRSTEATTAAAEKFKLDTDSVASFMDEACEFDADANTKRSVLYAAYGRYCEKAIGRVPLQRRRFLDRIRDDHPKLVETKRDGYDVFVGIRVAADAADGLGT